MRLAVRAARSILALAGLLVLVAPASAHAAAQSGGERVTALDAVLTVTGDGSLLVAETIAYDFGSSEHHGIYRDIPTRFIYEPDDQYDRVYPLDVLDVSSDTAPDEYEVSHEGQLTRIRIGDPDTTVTGAHTYRIEYRVEGALNGFDDHDELYWNAVGGQWVVPIERVSVRVEMPTEIQQVACFSGPTGSVQPCSTSGSSGATATFGQGGLFPGDNVTVVVGIPKGAVPEPAPVLEERYSLDRAFSRTPATLSAAGVLLGLVVAGVGALAWRVGRDRRAVGSPIDAAFATGADVEDQRVPLFGGHDVPVELVPPEGLRPGQLGTLVDERANPLDVTATIVDLAVRGYLRIEEIPKEGWFGKPDWTLHKLKDESGLEHEYERILFGSLFSGGDVVQLSDLKDRFAKKLEKVQKALYTDARTRGWFAGDPQTVRTKWALLGIFIAVDGIILTVAAAVWTEWALVPLPIILGGLLLVALSGRMPRRTAAGSAVLVRTLGFKRFIDESERDRARFAEQQHLFTEYLPYAVVFGATERWAAAFAGLDGELPDQSSWYVGTHPFTVGAFSQSIDGFSTTTAGTIASTPSSSGTSGFGGGGFSGGGGGGGGGGSW